MSLITDLSLSADKTCWQPARFKPIEKPPTPENKSKNNFDFLLNLNFINLKLFF